jgi:hypothetical protein
VAVTDQDLPGVELGLILGLVEDDMEEEAEADGLELVLLDDVVLGVIVIVVVAEADSLGEVDGLKEELMELVAVVEPVIVDVILIDLVTVGEAVNEAVSEAVREAVGLGLASTNSTRAVTPESIIE